jgi:hypothetical protein
MHSSSIVFYKIGRLQITTENGRLSDGTFEKLFTFGGRGFSVWRTDTMSRIYDSGSDVEDTHANARPDLFNAKPKSETIIKETVDSRSDNKVLYYDLLLILLVCTWFF